MYAFISFIDTNLTLVQWFIIALYGYTSILFAYCVSLISASALAAFSIVAGYQVVMFM
jgi:ATP-binding cassette subfamily A (ABC1) protein 3